MTFTTGTRKLFTTLGTTAIVSLALCAQAPAATTIGANPATVPTTGAGTCPLGSVTSTCAYVPQSASFTGYTVPVNGVITRWRVRSAAPGGAVAPVRAKVVREQAGGMILSVATSTDGLPANITGLAEASARMRVQAGDVLGLEFGTPSGPADPTLPYVFTTSGSANVWLLEPSVADGVSILAATDALIPMVGADIESDADNDGYGDETQDACPAVGSRHTGPCVDVPPATCKVPKLKGLSKSKAKAALTKAGCKLGKTTKKKSKKGKKGRSTAQKPKAGTVVPAGTSVTLTLRK